MHREAIFSPSTTPAAGWGAVPLLARVVSLDDPEQRNRVALGADRLFDKSTEIDALIEYCERLASGSDNRPAGLSG